MKSGLHLSLALTMLAAPAAQAADFTLPPGFSATVFADGLVGARHLTVRANGDVLVSMSGDDKGVVVLRDANHDGKADGQGKRFGDLRGTGIALAGADTLFFAADTSVWRYRLNADSMPVGKPVLVVDGWTQQQQHGSKSIALDGHGGLYVAVGAPSNSCQKDDRQPGSRGQQPCPLLNQYGGVWRYDANGANQKASSGDHWVTGARNLVAITWDAQAGALYGVMHGRDQLHDLWPAYFTEKQSTELPAEEFHRLDRGADLGWPYSYWDPFANVRRLAPEYGGDGQKTVESDHYRRPLWSFPAHWAPNDIMIYTGKAFPKSYQGGAFIAFHGSWNRAPLPQQGYRISFVPMTGGKVTGKAMDFATGFAGSKPISSPGEADFRPDGLAMGPDGALYIADDAKGRIWKVTYQGQ